MPCLSRAHDCQSGHSLPRHRRDLSLDLANEAAPVRALSALIVPGIRSAPGVGHRHGVHTEREVIMHWPTSGSERCGRWPP